MKRRRSQSIYYHTMVLPGMIFILIFGYIPMFGLVMAFQDFVPAKGFLKSEFVGIKHFKYMITLPDIGRVIGNTLIIAAGKIVLGMLLSI